MTAIANTAAVAPAAPVADAAAFNPRAGVAASREELVAVLAAAGKAVGTAAIRLEAASIALTRAALRARLSNICEDADAFRAAIKDAFDPLHEAGLLARKTGQNYTSYLVAVFRADKLPAGVEDMPLQAAYKSVKSENPHQFQQRAPRPAASATPAGGRGTAGAKAPEPKALTAGPVDTTATNPLLALQAALNNVRALATTPAALSLVAELTDLAEDLAQALAAQSAA